ncbi:hypothetical protein H6G74_01255 [Nostoc spongiaeforme FACHB-130]|uniref:Uncharacterized protein n=1 Tax=Nostoc spongiaeforme FACHB-130 TaxID=1357510 RepID=A0ABR8FNA0_9NOSO|nr:hypothetical protein [Nostoc spongiaeforme]MBD2592954.1 hypothetical protein [Nostoc spongiaeforme FACHB-130]
MKYIITLPYSPPIYIVFSYTVTKIGVWGVWGVWEVWEVWEVWGVWVWGKENLAVSSLVYVSVTKKVLN